MYIYATFPSDPRLKILAWSGPNLTQLTDESWAGQPVIGNLACVSMEVQGSIKPDIAWAKAYTSQTDWCFSQLRIPNKWIIPSVAPAAKILLLWLKHTEVIAGGSSPKGRHDYDMKEISNLSHAHGSYHNIRQQEMLLFLTYQRLPCFHVPKG